MTLVNISALFCPKRTIKQEHLGNIPSLWNGVPKDIGDVLKWKNGAKYFFKGELYYKYNDEADEVESQADPPFPRSSADWWFGCENSLTLGSMFGSNDFTYSANSTVNTTQSIDLPRLEVKISDFESNSSTQGSSGDFSK